MEMRRTVVGVVQVLEVLKKNNRQTPRPSLKMIRKNAPSFWIAAKDQADAALQCRWLAASGSRVVLNFFIEVMSQSRRLHSNTLCGAFFGALVLQVL